MNKQVVGSICKWVSIAFVAIAAICAINGGVSGSDVLRDLAGDSYISDDGETPLMNMYEAVAEMRYSKEIVLNDKEEKQLFSIFYTYDKIDDDGKVTLIEFRKILKDGISFCSVLYNNPTVGDFFDIPHLLAKDWMNVFKGVYRGVLFIVFGILLVGIIVIVLQILDKKYPVVLSIVVNLIWVLFLKLFAEDFLHGKITPAPVIALVLSIIAMILWIIKDKIAPNMGTVNVTPIAIPNFKPNFSKVNINVDRIQKSIPRPASASNTVCGNCGNVLRPGSKFCNICGAKYEEPVADFDVPKKAVNVDVYCQNCGAKLDDDAMFCDECGCRRS